MRRYRLLKDLPTFKAGDIFELEVIGNIHENPELLEGKK